MDTTQTEQNVLQRLAEKGNPMTTKQRTPIMDESEVLETVVCADRAYDVPRDVAATLRGYKTQQAALLAALRMAMNAWALHKLETEPWHDVARAAIAAAEKQS